MKKKIYKGILIGFGAILLILIITNPSNEKYTEFIKANGYKIQKYYVSKLSVPDYNDEENIKALEPYWGRQRNYFIFSIYEYHNGSTLYWSDTKRHIGVLGNFYQTR